eukprot:COSAG01_NODE_5705_length_4086_cov_4.307249_5_plen_113_part_00
MPALQRVRTCTCDFVATAELTLLVMYNPGFKSAEAVYDEAASAVTIVRIAHCIRILCARLSCRWDQGAPDFPAQDGRGPALASRLRCLRPSARWTAPMSRQASGGSAALVCL